MASQSAALSGVGLDVVKLFREVNAINKHVEDGKYAQWPGDLFAAESDRFEVWAVNLGLFVPGHGSLDYRIREASSLRAALLRFMSDLKYSLAEVLEYCDGTIDDLVPDEESTDFPLDLASLSDGSGDSPIEEKDSDIDLILDSLRDPIDRLYKLSTRIRNPTTRFGSSKALRYQKLDRESKVDFLQAVQQFDYDYVSSLFLQYRKLGVLQQSPAPLPPEGEMEGGDDGDAVWEPIRSVLKNYREDVSNNTESFLVRRIVRANICRRQQFAYWTRHREKLSLHTRAYSQEVQVPIETAQVRTNAEAQVTGDLGPVEPMELSVTTATRLQAAHLTIRDDQSTMSVSEYAPSTHVSIDDVDFPAAPRRKGDEKFFECPYCFTICRSELLGPKAWKAHLIRDMRPYICTYEDCKNPDQLYDTRLDWIQHENSSHRTVWRCPEHQGQPFASVVDYQAHLSDGHVASGNEIPTNLIRASESVLAVSERCCPVCAFSCETAKTLHKHIALHLERFALFSLPRSVGEDDDEANSQNVNIADDSSRGDSGDNGEALSNMEEDDNDDGYPSGSAAGIARRRWKLVLDRICHDQLGFDREVRFRIARSFRSPLRSMHETAASYVVQGRLREAEDLYAEILETRRRAFGSQHPSTLTSMSELAFVYEQEGLKRKADELRNEVAQGRARLSVLNPLTSAANLAVPYRNQDQLQEAEELELRLKAAAELDKQRKLSEFAQKQPSTSSVMELGKQADQDLLSSYQAKLFEAVRTGNRAAVELIVSTEGINPDLPDSNDRTPLSWSAGFGDTELVQLFLSLADVDPDFPDCRGQTPLSWAADCGHAEVVALLLDSGRVNPDSRDASGWTPLAWAASKGYDAVVRLLLGRDAIDADSRSASGLTPLAWAVVNGYEHVAKLLLDSGRVNVNYDGSNGRTLMSYAEKNGNEALIQLLEEYLPETSVSEVDQ